MDPRIVNVLEQLPRSVARNVWVDKSGCWLWIASVNKGGYGQCYRGGKLHRAHRLVYSLMVGPIPDGLQLDHLCRRRCCVNPEHLEPVTAKENVRRSLSARTQGANVCQRGHQVEGDNDYRGACRECSRQAVQRYRERKKALTLSV